MNRAERRKRTYKIVNRRKKAMEWGGIAIPPERAGESFSNETPEKYEKRMKKAEGRCKNMHPFDCGKPNCGVCRNKRCFLGLTEQEKRAMIDYQEQIDESNEEETC